MIHLNTTVTITEGLRTIDSGKARLEHQQIYTKQHQQLKLILHFQKILEVLLTLQIRKFRRSC